MTVRLLSGGVKDSVQETLINSDVINTNALIVMDCQTININKNTAHNGAYMRLPCKGIKKTGSQYITAQLATCRYNMQSVSKSALGDPALAAWPPSQSCPSLFY